jgi:ergothioneine biosynthesis protein EgtB
MAARYCDVRSTTEGLAAPLSAEDQTVQSMPDVSPTKWHRGHTSWFFETFLLGPSVDGYEVFDPRFGYLFNSYYEAVGSRHPRSERGLLSRPGIDEVAAYRRHVDHAMLCLIEQLNDPATASLVELGLNHEQQHQELLLMDIKHVLSRNPLQPAYRQALAAVADVPQRELGWVAHEGGVVNIGHDDPTFSFDNETPRHRAVLEPFAMADRLVTNAEWLAFVDDGGYQRPELWLSDGWSTVVGEGWAAPSYWMVADEQRHEFSLAGLQPLVPAAPVCHVSYFEADAFANWAGGRLPTEVEWEAVAAGRPVDGRFLDSSALHPRPASSSGTGVQQLFGDVWEWTSSPYTPYPRFRPAAGAVGEYNGKFMINQQVLRGGSCFTPIGHIRPTYRNFFPPAARWACSGVRLARDA